MPPPPTHPEQEQQPDTVVMSNAHAPGERSVPRVGPWPGGCGAPWGRGGPFAGPVSRFPAACVEKWKGILKSKVYKLHRWPAATERLRNSSPAPRGAGAPNGRSRGGRVGRGRCAPVAPGWGGVLRVRGAHRCHVRQRWEPSTGVEEKKQCFLTSISPSEKAQLRCFPRHIFFCTLAEVYLFKRGFSRTEEQRSRSSQLVLSS